jgi:hypothetical protein
MSDSLYYTYIVDKPSSEAFFVPNGFEANVEVHLWGAGGGPGSASAGGAGGYVKSTVTIAEGDFFEITVGGAGGAAGAGAGGAGGAAGQGAGLHSVSFAYGFGGGVGGTGTPYPGGDDQIGGAGGGGGGATVVIVNGAAVAVAAGGGGGGGGYSYQTGYPGFPGGAAGRFTTTSSGGDGVSAYAASGGGGGGYLGGEAGGVNLTGPSGTGDDAGGGGAGYGGQSLGDLSIPGSDTTAGGRTTIYAPKSPPYGNAGYDGYAVLIFKRKYRIYNKISNGNVQLAFNSNIVANIGEYISQTSSGANSIVISGTTTSNTVTVIYTTANVFTNGSGNVTINGKNTGNIVTVSFSGNTTASINNYVSQPSTGANLIVRSVNSGANLLVLEYLNTNTLITNSNIIVNGTRVEAFNPARKQIYFSGNISANIGNYITQTVSGNIANALVVANSSTNTVTVSYQNANVFVLSNVANVSVNGASTSVYPSTSSNIGVYPTSIVANAIYPTSYTLLSDWKSVDKVWYKTPYAGTLANVNVQTFSTVGDNAFVVPYLVKNLTVSYPTPTGMATKLFPVTAGETVTITIGDFGVTTTLKGTAGTLTLPAFDTPVFNYNGNVDHIIAQDVSVATDTGAPMSVGGSNATITAAAASAGIYYNVTYEGWHGDLYAEINFTPVKKSVCLNNLQVYVASGSGRQFPSAHTYQQQPTVANGYIMNDYQGDYYGGEGGYSWTTNLQQQGYVTITYDQAYTPGTWLPVTNVYYKDGDWKPLINNVDLKALVARTLIYKGLTTGTFTVPAGTTKVYARLIGGGGGGGGSYSTAAVRGLPGQIVQGAVTVTPGDVLTVSVGGGGGGGEDYVPPAASGGGGGCKIICTKLHELGYLPDNIYAADELFGQWLRENDPYAYYGYVKWASVVVDWMESDGPQCMFWIKDKDKRGQAQRELAIKWARRIATPWAEHMAYKMGVGETDNRAGRMIMTTGMWISRLIGKYTKTTEPSKSVALGYVMWATFGVFWLLAGIK